MIYNEVAQWVILFLIILGNINQSILIDKQAINVLEYMNETNDKIIAPIKQDKK